jgi:gliding motility-associated-like protein
LEIFDRWGELIYTSTDPNDGWDGTYMQNKVQEDVYVWRVTYTNILQKHGQMIGRVTLIE